MKGAAIVVLLILAALPSAQGLVSTTREPVAAMGGDQVEPGAPGGNMPVDQPIGTATDTAAASTAATGTNANQGGGAMNSEAQLLAQAGAIGILTVVLFFYRRDFFTKDERAREKAELEKRELEERERERQEERRELSTLIANSNACITNSAVATARQTDATHRLARTVENIERRAAGLPPTAGGTTP